MDVNNALIIKGAEDEKELKKQVCEMINQVERDCYMQYMEWTITIGFTEEYNGTR